MPPRDRWPSGSRRAPGERVGGIPVSWVRIPPCPSIYTKNTGRPRLPAFFGGESNAEVSNRDEPSPKPASRRPAAQPRTALSESCQDSPGIPSSASPSASGTVRSGEHAVRRLDIPELPAHEQPEYGTTEALGERRDIVQRQRHERAIRPEPAIGDQEVRMRVPVDQGAVGLDPTSQAAGKRSHRLTRNEVQSRGRSWPPVVRADKWPAGLGSARRRRPPRS